MRLGRIAGIEVSLHWSWAIIAVLVVLAFAGRLQAVHTDLDPAPTVGLAVGGTVIFFGSVLLHELAHALVARRRGITVAGITLYLFGGATEADASSRSPGDEFAVAIAGPATSLGIAGVLGLLSAVVGASDAPLPDMLGYLAILNLVLAVFNMAPGLPLDGGRVVRSIAWAVTGDFERATRWATSAGIALGYLLIGFGLVTVWQGLIGGLWLIGIGWMIGQSARQNEQQERLRSTFGDLTAGDVMTSTVITIPTGTSVAEALRDYLAHCDQTVFPVVDQGRPIGLLTAASTRRVRPEDVWTTSVDQLALQHQPALVADPSTPMFEIIDALASRPEAKARVLVVDQGRLAGIISPADVLRRQALRDLLDQVADG